MTRERAKELAPMIAAYGNGETVQVPDGMGGFRDNDRPLWDDGSRYRIKPKPVTRPWSKPEDVPGPVCWVKRSKGDDWARMVIMINPARISCIGGHCIDVASFDWEEMKKEGFLHSTDLKTWHPCTVTEESK